MVLAEPGLVVAELVEMLDELQIALERERRILADRVERGQEDPELQSAVGVNGGHRSLRRLGGLFVLGALPGALGASFTHEPEGCPFENSPAPVPEADLAGPEIDRASDGSPLNDGARRAMV